MVPTFCHPKVLNVGNNYYEKVVQKQCIPENYQVLVKEWFTCYCFVNGSIKLEKVTKNFWNDLECLRKL